MKSTSSIGGFAEADPPVPPPDPQFPTAEEMTKLFRDQEILKWTQGLNPAYHPLIPVVVTQQDSPDDWQVLFALPYYSSLKELQAYLELKRLVRDRKIFEDWLSQYQGLLPDRPTSSGKLAEVGSDEIMRLTGRCWRIVEIWLIEARIGLATADERPLLSFLDKFFRVAEALSVASIDTALACAQWFDMLIPFLTASLNGASPRLCGQIVGFIDRWRHRESWRTGVGRSFAQDLADVDRIIPNSGELAFDEVDAPAAESEPSPPSASLKDDPPTTALEPPDAPTETKPENEDNGVPTPLALLRRQTMRDAVNELYELSYRVMADPFARQPKQKDCPGWLLRSLLATSATKLCMDLDDGATPPDLVGLRRLSVCLSLLATHALIRKYRWEHDAHPPKLAALESPRYTTNPFTKKPFDYKFTADGYELTSPEIPDAPDGTFPTGRGDTINLRLESAMDGIETQSDDAMQETDAPIQLMSSIPN